MDDEAALERNLIDYGLGDGNQRPVGTRAVHLVHPKDPAFASARQVLAAHGVDFNSHINGIFLPIDTHSSHAAVPRERIVGNPRFAAYLNEALRTQQDSTAAVEQVLSDTYLRLSAGNDQFF